MKALILSLLLALSSAGFAREVSLDGQETQNGGGAAEQTFAYALTMMKPLYQMCLSISSCLQNEKQREILGKIYASLDAELASPALLRFAAGWWPNFLRDGQVRVAVTGSKVGDTIYLNRNMIYTRHGRSLAPYSLSEAVGLLTHELGHHQGEKDHDLLDMLGANVRAFFDSKKEAIRVDSFSGRFANADIRLNVFHSRQAVLPFAHTSTFWLSVGDKFFDLNPDIQRQMSCPALESVKAELKGFRFYQMHWGEPTFFANGRVQYPLEAKVWIECLVQVPGGYVSHMSVPHNASITFDFLPADSELVYIDHSLKVEVSPEDNF